MDVRPPYDRPRVLHRTLVRVKPSPASPESPGIASLIAQGIWFGLVGAWLELGVLLVHRIVVGDVTAVSRRINWYHAPLGVIAHLALFLPWIAITVLLRRRGPFTPRRDSVWTVVAWYLAILSPLLAIEELYWPCAHVLAGAFAMRVAPWWRSRRSSILRTSLPWISLASVVLLIAGFAWQSSSERRAMAALPAPKPDSPNVVLIVLDTVRADHLSLYGYGRDTTPRLKALADRGYCFEFARSAAPWTLPSHASMFTGRWPHELSVDVDRPLDGTYPTIAEHLSKRGYATGGFAANTSYTNAWYGLARGFAHYEDCVENRTISTQETLRTAAIFRCLMPYAVRLGLWKNRADIVRRRPSVEIRNESIAWLDSQTSKRPFFMFLNFYDAHDPYEVPPNFAAMFSRESSEAVRIANRDYLRNMRKGGDKSKAFAARRILMDVYDDSIRSMDEQIGGLVDDLDRRGHLRDTWIIVTADHGEYFGENGGKYGHGSGLNRPVIDVPLLIVPPRGDRVGSASRIKKAVSTRDLPATIAELSGSSEARPFPGRSLSRYWDRSATDSDDESVPISETKVSDQDLIDGVKSPGDRFDAAIVSGDRILHRYRNGDDELYDTDDRAESENLAPRASEKSTLDRLRELVKTLTGKNSS